MARGSGARVGTVYLLHFDRRYRHAGHYIGWTTDLDARLAQHRAGEGARLLAVITAAGIGWSLARTWPRSTRARERSIKKQGGAARSCPTCGRPTRGPAAAAQLAELAAEQAACAAAGRRPADLDRARGAYLADLEASP